MTWPCVLAHVVFLLLAGVTLGGGDAGPSPTASSTPATGAWYGWLGQRGGDAGNNETATSLSAPLQASGGSTKTARQSHVPPRPQRAKWISNAVTSEELYQAYEEVKKEYMEKAFSSTRPWKVLKETAEGVQIALLEHEHDVTCPYVRMRAVMPGSVEEVWNYLRVSNWGETMPKVDPFYEGHEVLGYYQFEKRFRGIRAETVDMTIVRKRTKRVVTFGKRDFMFISVCDAPTPDGVWVSGTVSIKGPPHFARKRGYIRAFQDSIAFYEPLSDSQTCLTIVVRIDLNDSEGLGGNIPMWFYVKTVGQSGVLTMATMRRELLKARSLTAAAEQGDETVEAAGIPPQQQRSVGAVSEDKMNLETCPKEEESPSPCQISGHGGGGRRRRRSSKDDDMRLPLLPWMSLFSKSSLPLYPHYGKTTTTKRRKTLCEQGRDSDDSRP